ncbi:hypothetical protein B5S31_g1771 [[Candida] boidinii]|nr:hypothetical protein B5S31_g1771 [[Candida] boidinii]
MFTKQEKEIFKLYFNLEGKEENQVTENITQILNTAKSFLPCSDFTNINSTDVSDANTIHKIFKFDSSFWKFNKTFTSRIALDSSKFNTPNAKDIILDTLTFKSTSTADLDSVWAGRATIIDLLKFESVPDFLDKFILNLTGLKFKYESTEYSKDSIIDPFLHTENESNYIEYIQNYKKLNFKNHTENDNNTLFIDDKGILINVSLIYKLSPILSLRKFSEYIFTSLPIVGEEGIISIFLISLVNKDTDNNANLVIGKYFSIEKLEIDLNSKKLIWKMVTLSDSGGYLPRFIQNMAICKEISHDVLNFVEYLLKELI